MNVAALLSLIADLYSQVQQVTRERDELRAALNRQSSEPTGE